MSELEQAMVMLAELRGQGMPWLEREHFVKNAIGGTYEPLTKQMSKLDAGSMDDLIRNVSSKNPFEGNVMREAGNYIKRTQLQNMLENMSRKEAMKNAGKKVLGVAGKAMGPLSILLDILVPNEKLNDDPKEEARMMALIKLQKEALAKKDGKVEPMRENDEMAEGEDDEGMDKEKLKGASIDEMLKKK